MTEQIKSAISELETIRDNYDWRDYVTDESYDDCLNKAIRSLKAWEEVLQELEELAMQHLENGESESYADVSVCIDHIKIHLQKLAEIKE